MTKPRDTATDQHETMPPPPSITVTAEIAVADLEHLEPLEGTVFGVELADGAHGSSRRAFLVVHEGQNGTVMELADGQEVTFGRSSSTTVIVDDPRVSRHHARIYRKGPILMVEDLASRNGTKVNGASLRAARRIVVSGDTVRVGSCEVIVGSSIREVDHAEDASIGVAVADAKMRDVFALAKQLASGDTPVLIQGEAGSGKKVVAQQVHRWSGRAARPFVRIDCAGLPDMILERALFGTEGSGDAAGPRVVGHLEAASGGTLLLDGVGELSTAAQAKLLSALETRRIVRLGGKAEIPIDVRVLGATDRDLPAEVAAKRFREDLYYAISAFTLRVPPLRERHAEIDLFAQLFLARFAERRGVPVPALEADAAMQLLRYEWPDNVRELSAAMRDAVASARGSIVTRDDLPDPVQQARAPSVRVRV
jgi:transcriptional regulator with PAS, ATPase and Fis domain